MAKRIVCWGGTELFTSEVKTTSDRSPVVALKEGECLSAAIRLPSVVAIERHWHRWRWFAFWVEVSKIITSTLPIRELMGRCCGIFLAKSEQNWMLPYSLSSSLNYFNWSIARSRSYHSIPYKNNPWICFDDTFFPPILWVCVTESHNWITKTTRSQLKKKRIIMKTESWKWPRTNYEASKSRFHSVLTIIWSTSFRNVNTQQQKNTKHMMSNDLMSPIHQSNRNKHTTFRWSWLIKIFLNNLWNCRIFTCDITRNFIRK